METWSAVTLALALLVPFLSPDEPISEDEKNAEGAKEKAYQKTDPPLFPHESADARTENATGDTDANNQDFHC